MAIVSFEPGPPGFLGKIGAGMSRCAIGRGICTGTRYALFAPQLEFRVKHLTQPEHLSVFPVSWITVR